MSWAVVTGASGGIGVELVRQLAEKEPNLHFLLVARREEQLKEIQAELKGKSVRAEFLALDLTKLEAVQVIEQKIRKSGYAVRYLLNNAGAGWFGRFDEQSTECIVDMIGLNITMLTLLTRRIIPLMETDGHIVNIASSAAFAPMGGMAVYAATKAYVLNFSLALDVEIRKEREISVTAVCPGPVGTSFFSRAEMKSIPAPAYLIESPAVTARRAIRAAVRGRPLISTGMAAWSMRLLSWWIPARMIARSSVNRLGQERV